MPYDAYLRWYRVVVIGSVRRAALAGSQGTVTAKASYGGKRADAVALAENAAGGEERLGLFGGHGSCEVVALAPVAA